jgi:hypothetical protein
MPTTLVVVLAFSLLAPWCRSEDWLVKGRTYHNVNVIGVNPDTVSVTYDGGTGRLQLADLTPELQAKFKDAAVLATAATTDPIAHLVVSLSGTYGMWVNGMSPVINQPKNATADQLVPEALRPLVRFEHYQIIRIEKVEQVKIDPVIPNSNYMAALVHGNPSDKIVLFQYINERVGWYSKVFDSGW